MKKRKETKEIVNLGMDKLEDDPIEEGLKSLAELVREAGKKFEFKDESEDKGSLPQK